MHKPLKILQASAGSGKTFSLTAHYLTLLFSSPNKYREILAVTFTNKATEEMKTRILQVLKGFAAGSSGYESYQTMVLAAHPGLDAVSLQQQADQTYRKILHDYSRFAVNTIDGFVQKVVRGFAFELGLEAGYALEMNEEKVKNELADRLEKVLDEQPELLQWIIDLAKERIANGQNWNYRRELLDLSGEIFKERYQPFEHAVTELSRTADIDSLFKDYQTLTKLQISGFKEEISNLAAEATQLLDVLDIDPSQVKGKSRSPLWNLKKIAEGDFTKIKSLLKLVDEPEEWFSSKTTAPAAAYDELNPAIKELTATYQEGLAAYTTAVGFNKNLFYLRLMQEMAVILKSYREESGSLLISDAQNLLKGITDDANDNPSFIWEKMGNRYKNFLFDEFQDTSTNQWASFRSLVGNAIASPSGKLTDHLIVGDTKQSIYRWRNGDWNILHRHASADIGPHNIVEDSLEENYRSTTNIIAFNNMLFPKLAAVMQQVLNDHIADDAGHDTATWWNMQGYNDIVNNIYKNAVQNITPFTKAGGTVKYRVLRADEDGSPLTATSFTATAIAATIAEIKTLIEEQKFQPRNICVLVRRNAEAVAMVKALLENNINVISGEALLIGSNNAVKLILNTLQAIIGVPAQTALYKANCISLFARLRGEKVDPQHLLGLSFKTMADLRGILPSELCENYHRWVQQPLAELVEKIIQAYGLDKQETEISYLLAFRDIVGAFMARGDQGVTAFMRYWDEEGLKKALPASENVDAVQVVTIHKSKGLAYDAVLIPFCNWAVGGTTNSIFWVPASETPYQALNSIPLKYTKELGNSTVARAYFEELLFNNMDALNMLYVATTRAREYLYITSMGKRTASMNNIGDMLENALNASLSEDSYVNESYLSAKQYTAEDNTLRLTVYPVSDRLSEIFDASLKRRELSMVNTSEAGRIGTILHEILAQAATAETVRSVLDTLLEDGNIQANEVSELEKQANQVLNNTALQQLLKAGGQTLNEQTIIATDGKSYRPDKVIINDQNVTIIDYKFTQEESDRHIEQIDHYKGLLAAMGYQHVSAYLFYANNDLLKKI